MLQVGINSPFKYHCSVSGEGEEGNVPEPTLGSADGADVGDILWNALTALHIRHVIYSQSNIGLVGCGLRRAVFHGSEVTAHENRLVSGAAHPIMDNFSKDTRKGKLDT